jgi:hypothetical protein
MENIKKDSLSSANRKLFFFIIFVKNKSIQSDAINLPPKVNQFYQTISPLSILSRLSFAM